MPIVKARACTILGEFEQAQMELIGKAVILTDGKAGTVESVSLDEMHGLRIAITATMGSGLSRRSSSRSRAKNPKHGGCVASRIPASKMDAPNKNPAIGRGQVTRRDRPDRCATAQIGQGSCPELKLPLEAGRWGSGPICFDAWGWN